MDGNLHEVRATVAQAAEDPNLRLVRKDLAFFAASVFGEVGEGLHVAGHIFGTDRMEGKSPFQHGSDEVVGVSLLMRIACPLTSASAELLTEGRPYAGAALLRQIVEIEYLAWAFENRHSDAERWLRSDGRIRETFFRPAKLRKAASGRFRNADYGFHCELGGHPVPTGSIVLRNDLTTNELLLSDLLGHAGSIWNHFVGWAQRYEDYAQHFMGRSVEMSQRFREWKASDPLVGLPPP